MPVAARKITPEDILPDAAFAPTRRERRAALLPVKRLRRIALGPICTVYFESFETMLFQVQEMLLTEGGGAAQLVDELAAYNPLIPQGRELVATVMFEIDDPLRRDGALRSLGGVDRHLFLEVGGRRIDGVPEGDIERTRDDGKTSSVHFVRFAFADADAEAFREPGARVLIACDHPNYGHQATISEVSRAELAKDLA
jgi:Protein of unknown function (DUF3501)